MEVSQNFNYLEVMPDELQLLMYQHLSPEDLIILSLVSKKFKELAEDNSLWRSHCEQNFPDSAHKLQSSLETRVKRQRMEEQPWKTLYRECSLFYEAISNNNLPCQALQGVRSLCLFQDKIYINRGSEITVWNTNQIFFSTEKPLLEKKTEGYWNAFMHKIEQYEDSNKLNRSLIYCSVMKDFYGSSNEILILDATTLNPIGEGVQHPGCIRDIVTYKDKIITICNDSVTRIWNAADYTLEKELEGRLCISVLTIAENKIFVGFYGSIRIWDAESYELLKEITDIPCQNASIFCIKIYNRKIYASTETGIFSYNLDNYNFLGKISEINVEPRVFDVYDNKIFYQDSNDNSIRIWDMKLQKCIGRLKGHSGCVNHLQVDSNKIFSNTIRKFRLWGFCPE